MSEEKTKELVDRSTERLMGLLKAVEFYVQKAHPEYKLESPEFRKAFLEDTRELLNHLNMPNVDGFIDSVLASHSGEIK